MLPYRASGIGSDGIVLFDQSFPSLEHAVQYAQLEWPSAVRLIVWHSPFGQLDIALPYLVSV